MLHIFTEYLMLRELARAMPIGLPSLGKPEAWLLGPQAPGPTGGRSDSRRQGLPVGPGMVTSEASCSWRWLLPSHSWLLPRSAPGAGRPVMSARTAVSAGLPFQVLCLSEPG